MSTEEYCDETAEFGMTLDEALDTEEAAPEREITIVFSGGDWVSYAGERYTLCKRKPPEGSGERRGSCHQDALPRGAERRYDRGLPVR